MKCPNCGYVNGFDYDAAIDVKGEHGKFYCLPIDMVRTSSEEPWRKSEKAVHGCPRCGILFMGSV